MDNTFTITISREYGSGGRQIGENLARGLGINFYDKEILPMVAEKSGLSAGFVEKSDENIPGSFLFNLKYSTYASMDAVTYYDTPITDKVFLAQSSVIKDLAANESCIIVGRCADYVLREKPGLVRIFIRAEMEDRIARAVESYSMTSDKAEYKIKKIDKGRSNYYKYYTSHKWGDMSYFDLVINTSFTDIDGAVAIITTMLREKGMVK